MNMVLTVNKKHISAGAILLLVNCLSRLVMLPYVQQTANSHMNADTAMAILYCLAGALVTALSTWWYHKRKDVKLLALSMLIVSSLLLWGYAFIQVYCQKCASME
jgi:multidrug transporter EmrE-like cation transporter